MAKYSTIGHRLIMVIVQVLSAFFLFACVTVSNQSPGSDGLHHLTRLLADIERICKPPENS